MKTRTRSLLSLGGLLLALAAVIVLISSPAVAAPGNAPAVGALNLATSGMAVTNLPPTTCVLVSSTRTCDLWAMTGSIVMPTGENLPIWGFADNAGGPAQVPGPVLIANQGETLEVVLHNELLSEMVSLVFPGQPDMLPDLVGITAGDVTTYTVALTNPGTFLYEAGLTDNGARQVAMGLYGALIVRPAAAGQAYDDPATAYDDEALLVLSEMDPALNNDPNGFEMQYYQPRYWLINGQAYPQTTEIDTVAGNIVLLRYVNAGLETHGMGLLGLRQQIIASQGRPLTWPYTVVAETIASGQTMDVLTTIPALAEVDSRFALYNTSLLLHNASQQLAPDGPVAFGGMMTFLHTVTGASPTAVGPLAGGLRIGPNPTTGASGVRLLARITDMPTGGLNVVAAEYFTDTVHAPGTGIPMSLNAIAPSVSARAAISPAELAKWPSGFHIFYVHGQDSGGSWGPFNSVVLNLDKVGPTTSGLSLFPEPTNGDQPVLLRATGDDHASGRNNVIAGEYSIDGGPAQPMILSSINMPVAAMTATLSVPTLQALGEGLHPIAVASQDSLLNWGQPSTITLTLDQTGPMSPVVTLTPDVLDLSGAPAVTQVRLEAVINDSLSSGVQSPLANAEAFVDSAGPDGSGFALFPADGLFDAVSEAVYFDIPLANFLKLAQGDHDVLVHGLDVAGNWGDLGKATIYIDRGATDADGPTVTSLSMSPNPTNGAVLISLTAGATDPGLLNNVSAGEWFVGTDPGPGAGTSLLAADGAFDSPTELMVGTIDVSGWANQFYTVRVRAQDALFNWGPLMSASLYVQGNAAAVILFDSFEIAGFEAWSDAVGAVDTVSQAAMAPDGGIMGMRAVVDGAAPAYLSHLMPAGESSYRASFYFDPNGANFGSQQHDILVGLSGDTPVFGIQVEADGSGSGYEVRAWVLSGGVARFTNWYGIDDASHKLTLGWNAGADATFYLAVDGAVKENLNGLDTSAYLLHEARLGPSSNLDPAMSGAEYFDGFQAMRNYNLFLPLVLQGN